MRILNCLYSVVRFFPHIKLGDLYELVKKHLDMMSK